MNRAVPMIDHLEPPPPPPPPSSDRPKSNLASLYYGLLVVGAAAIVLAVYNLIIIKWCVRRRRLQQQSRERQRPNNGFIEATTAASSDQSFDNNIIMNRNLTLLSSFTYHKKEGDDNYEHECAVCLSVFEEGEEVRRLPSCKHSFHVSCIDMWLYSHFDCPLCRAPINQVTRFGLHLQVQVDHSHESQEHSTEFLLASGISRQNS